MCGASSLKLLTSPTKNTPLIVCAVQDQPLGVSAEVGARMLSSPLWASPCHLQALSCIKCLSPSAGVSLTESFLNRCYGPSPSNCVSSLSVSNWRSTNEETHQQPLHPCTPPLLPLCAVSEPPSPLARTVSGLPAGLPASALAPSLLSVPHPNVRGSLLKQKSDYVTHSAAENAPRCSIGSSGPM